MTPTQIAINFYKEVREQGNKDMILRAENDLKNLGIPEPCFYVFNFHNPGEERSYSYSHSYYSWMENKEEATKYAESFANIYDVEYFETCPTVLKSAYPY